ncbi:uncharacterized protein LOC129770592 isoform X1 [Toxorhynchites rutilus septentrionalis]|uniref:uncharacterized protein LOC129768634 n=1 Tax=Toxorhynchites rutilus septentrionalis TaxID=329112 RepID=UPI00247A858A|nr:uncharacterized protein LOC129768634 [Toxorhynchites rutilus septentrionalis]XP_055629501.1 uncharacterized protein LOC129770592 isoform X1 [Toxorhynchites rutilus septentrionalis]
MPPEDLDCGLIFDEMSIEEAKSFCVSTSQFYGDITIPGQSGLATHALVFVLVGVRARWKQTVGYHFTGNSIPDNDLNEIIYKIIQEVESFGCKVHFLTSDCGPKNKKLWNALGLKFHKHVVLNSEAIEHPTVSSRKLEIIPDVVHVFKSAVQGWIKNEVLWLPPDVVASNGFCSNEVNIQHLHDLVHYEQQNLLKVAHNLKPEDVEFEKKRNNFDVMKVINSEKIVNRNVSAALRFYSHAANRPEVLPTAYFIETLSQWFQLSKNRSMKMALSKENSQKYKETLQFYIFFKKFIYAVEVGHKRYWKPWQASIILATNAILRLQDMFLNVKGYSFLFTARFTQDCVENIFSLIRIRQKKPTALQFKCFLKSLTISQYLTVVSGSSYETDDTDWLLNFPSNVKQLKEKKAIEERKVPDINELTKIDTQAALKEINDNEKNVVYHLAGMVVYKVAKHGAVC